MPLCNVLCRLYNYKRLLDIIVKLGTYIKTIFKLRNRTLSTFVYRIVPLYNSKFKNGVCFVNLNI